MAYCIIGKICLILNSMTLHKTVQIAKKTAAGISVGILITIMLVLLFRLGVTVKNTLFPPEKQLPNHFYGVVPALKFPQSASSLNFTYNVNTVTGGLPEFPDRVDIFPIIQAQPNLLNL